MTDPTREQLLEEIPKLRRLERMATQHAFDAEADRDRERAALANAKAEIARLREQRSTANADTYAMYVKQYDECQVLQDRIAKVRFMAVNANDGCAYCADEKLVDAREILAVLDGEGEKATGGIITKPVPIGQHGCVIDAWKDTP